MAEESKRDNYDRARSDDDPVGSDADRDEDDEELSEEEQEASVGKRAGKPETADETLSASDSGWFVDFDVWQATLEAKFGPEFEQVLSSELGPDWINRLNLKIRSATNFHKVLDEIKRDIAGSQSQLGGPEQLFEIDDDLGDDDRVGFEALGPGEIIYDESMVGPGGSGHGSRERELPNLSDVRKKDFDSAGEQKSSLDEAFKGDEIDSGATTPDDEIVLMDKNDFSRLSYFARKELDRHKDDLETKKVLERESKKLFKRTPLGTLNTLLLFLAGAVFLYAVYALIALPFGEYYEDQVQAANSPDYLFQPSTTLHRQGELNRAADPNQPGGGGGALSFYFLQPSLKRFELRHVIGSSQTKYDLDLYNGKDLEIGAGPWGDAIEVHRLYSQNWPTNRSALFKSPYLSLSLDGEPVLLAFETRRSGMLPGLLELDIVTNDGSLVGMAYVADNLLNIRITDDSRRTGQAEVELTRQLVFLFSLLEI